MRKGAVKDNAAAIYIDEGCTKLPVTKQEEPLQMLNEARTFTQQRHGRFMRVDLNTPLENFVLFSILALFAVFIASLRGLFGLPYAVYSAFLIAILAVVYSKLDCTYVLDNVSRIVYFFRRFGRFARREPVCGYGDIDCIATRGFRLEGKSSVSWSYDIVFVLKNGSIVPVSSTYGEYEDAEKDARILARHIGAPCKRNGKERELIVSYQYKRSKALAVRKELVVAYEEYSLFNHPFSLLCWSIFYALILLAVLL